MTPSGRAGAASVALASLLLLSLAACGGGGDSGGADAVSASVANTTCKTNAAQQDRLARTYRGTEAAIPANRYVTEALGVSAEKVTTGPDRVYSNLMFAYCTAHPNDTLAQAFAAVNHFVQSAGGPAAAQKVYARDSKNYKSPFGK